MFLIFPKQSLLELLSKTNVSLIRNASTRGGGKTKKIELINIMDLEINRKIFQTNLKKGYLNKWVHLALSENIRVPEESLKCGFSVIRNDFDSNFTNFKEKLPDKMKIGFYSPKEKELIVKNTESFTSTLSKKVDQKDVLNEVFLSVEDKDKTFLTEKIHIVGLYLSQGMEVIRLPCEVFHFARKLHLTIKEGFSDEEDEFILNYMKGEGATSNTPLADISKILKRPIATLHHRYYQILQHKNKYTNINKKFSLEENLKIIRKVLEVEETEVKDIKLGTSAEVWQQLGDDLSRNPLNIYKHWVRFLQPTLTRYEAGVLDIDFRELLIDHFVDNNIMFSQEANWEEIVKDQKFQGTTPIYLKGNDICQAWVLVLVYGRGLIQNSRSKKDQS